VSTIPQTGEKLPDYDEGPADGVDIDALHRWLLANRRGWYAAPNMGDPPAPAAIRDVLAALQAVGDATLVKNETYRAFTRDRADVERLSAYLAREGYTGPLVEHGGNPVTTIIAVIGDEQADRC
jgi:hypothetical protein